ADRTQRSRLTPSSPHLRLLSSPTRRSSDRTTASELGYDLVLTAERDDPADDWPERIRSRGSAGVIIGLIVPTSTQIAAMRRASRSEEHTSELQSRETRVCRLLLEKKKTAE